MELIVGWLSFLILVLVVELGVFFIKLYKLLYILSERLSATKYVSSPDVIDKLPVGKMIDMEQRSFIPTDTRSFTKSKAFEIPEKEVVGEENVQGKSEALKEVLGGRIPKV